jgi:hypothetical protein
MADKCKEICNILDKYIDEKKATIADRVELGLYNERIVELSPEQVYGMIDPFDHIYSARDIKKRIEDNGICSCR